MEEWCCVRLIPAELLDKLYGTRYGLVVVAAKRAMAIKDGLAPLIETDATNPLTIALLELAAGRIYLEQPQEKKKDTAQQSRAG
ncbi:MAG: DNA-directed RNA polymerase subunit omega [Armatimonadetes bacterium]|nr:DNA-directed RNA polymerase subunit omega [Armatimonadota bacterium]